MSKIKIICTSTGSIDYAPDRYKNMGIDILRVHVIYGGREYKEGYDLDPVAFYEYLETLEDPKKNLPSTAMPDTEDIRACFENAISEGCDEAIVYALSAYLGGTYSKICLVAREFEGRLKIHVVDTKVTGFNEGFLAVRAATLAAEGKSSEYILKDTAWTMEHQLFIGVDGKLDYLIYNGRLKGGKALMGQILNFCPVLTFNKAGECVSVETVRTTKKALVRTCELLKETIGDRSPEDYLLWHTFTGPSLIEELKGIEGRFDIKTNHEEIIMSPVVGSHNGPWLAGYGLIFLRRDDEPLE